MNKKSVIKSILRLFSAESYKGSRDYIRTQRVYEILRTALYFGISLSLFAAGYIATKSKLNLLTVAAVLGCLPASKSAVSMIMFLRYRGLGRRRLPGSSPAKENSPACTIWCSHLTPKLLRWDIWLSRAIRSAVTARDKISRKRNFRRIWNQF